MKDALKWILLAAGGYLAIRATGITLPTFGGDAPANTGGSGTGGSNATTSTGGSNTDSGTGGSGTGGSSATTSTGGSGRSGGANTGGNNRTSTNQTNAVEREAIIRRAAAGDAASIQKAVALGIKFNADQWNWYRQQETGVATTVDLFPESDRAALMDAAEYISRRQGAGLGWLGRRRF